MTKLVKAGTWWIYYGPGEGIGQYHIVVSVEQPIAPDEKVIPRITTWSALNNKGPGGYSWHGDPIDFVKWFSTAPSKPT